MGRFTAPTTDKIAAALPRLAVCSKAANSAITPAYKNAKISAEDLKELEKELGDVLWYLAVFADNLGLKLDDIARHNLQKLADRYKRGTLKGAGDNR